MSLSPALLFHVCSGSVALLSGAAAVFFRKGSHRHRVAGNVFVIAMLSLSASGAYLGFSRHQALNSLMGVLTFYLVTTAWLTARRRDGETGIFDFAALLVPLVVAASLLIYGVEAANSQTGAKDGYPAAAYFIFASLALIFAAGDIHMLVRGGVSGRHRIARHLRRMCVGFFISTGSFFLGQQRVFPTAVRETNILFVPAILPLALMIFWLFRVRFSNAYRQRAVLGETTHYRVSAIAGPAQPDRHEAALRSNQQM